MDTNGQTSSSPTFGISCWVIYPFRAKPSKGMSFAAVDFHITHFHSLFSFLPSSSQPELIIHATPLFGIPRKFQLLPIIFLSSTPSAIDRTEKLEILWDASNVIRDGTPHRAPIIFCYSAPSCWYHVRELHYEYPPSITIITSIKN